MRNWYLYVETDHDLTPVKWEVGPTSMPPNQHYGYGIMMYVIAEKELEKTMCTLNMKMKSAENLKKAIAAYYTGKA